MSYTTLKVPDPSPAPAWLASPADRMQGRGTRIYEVLHCGPNAIILTGETCEVLKTSQVFGEPARHDHCSEVLCPATIAIF